MSFTVLSLENSLLSLSFSLSSFLSFFLYLLTSLSFFYFSQPPPHLIADDIQRSTPASRLRPRVDGDWFDPPLPPLFCITQSLRIGKPGGLVSTRAFSDASKLVIPQLCAYTLLQYMYIYCTVYRTDVYVTQRCSKLLSWRHAPGFDTRRIFFPAPAEREKIINL